MPLNPKQTHSILETLGHAPNKKLGQNFLIDGNIVRKSIELAEIRPGDSVLEIGPGLGTLSEALLAEGTELYAVEKDPTLAQYLTEQLAQDTPSFHLLNADCTQAPLGLLPASASDASFKIVANLPYAVATPWLDSILSGRLPQRMVLMLQKEAVDRYSAAAQTKNFGAISIFLQSAYTIQSTHAVSASCFYPKPKVDSCLIRLDLKETPILYSREIKAFIRQIFTQRRKQIIPLCKKQANPKIQTWIDSLAAEGYEKTVRAEAIQLSSWQQLAYKTNHDPKKAP